MAFPTLYAVPADVTAWIGNNNPAPNPPYDNAELTRLIDRAQRLIDTYMISFLFAVSASDGYSPTDATVLATLKDATCAQVEFWIASGDELDELGQWQQFALPGGVSMTRRGDALEQRRSRLCDRARDEIRKNRLLPNWVSVP